MAGRYDSNPFEEEEVNPFSVSFSFPPVFFEFKWIWKFKFRGSDEFGCLGIRSGWFIDFVVDEASAVVWFDLVS